MSRGVNKVILIGHLGADPEVRYTANGSAVARLRLATTENYVDKSGNRQEITEWHTVTAWGKMAETCGQYLAKGKQVYIEGRLRTTSYEKDGVKRYTTEVVVRDMIMLGSPPERTGGREEPPFPPPPAAGAEDDFPF